MHNGNDHELGPNQFTNEELDEQLRERQSEEISDEELKTGERSEVGAETGDVGDNEKDVDE